MKIARNLALLLTAGALILASCENSFSGSKLKGAADAQEELNSANRDSNDFDATYITDNTDDADFLGIAALDADSATDNILVVRFKEKVDADTLATALTFYPLLTTTAADGSPDRGTAITFTVSAVRQNGTDYDAYINLGRLTGVSSRIELFIDGQILTARNGALMLDEDGDDVQGEDNDDDVFKYIATDSATIASAGTRDPRAGFNFSWTATANAVGTTTWTANYGTVAVDNSDYKALLDAIVRLERFDYTDGSWDNVAYTSTYSTTTGDYVITFAAFAAGETYRIRYVDLQGRQTAKTVQGYIQKIVSDQMTESWWLTRYVADPNQVGLVDADVDVSTTFSSGRGGYITLDFDSAVIGVEGLDTATVIADNLKILRGTVYVPFESVVVQKTNPADTVNKNNQVVLYLNPAYADTSALFSVLIGPGMRMLGATTATTDDRYFGSKADLVGPEYGFLTLDSDTNTL